MTPTVVSQIAEYTIAFSSDTYVPNGSAIAIKFPSEMEIKDNGNYPCLEHNSSAVTCSAAKNILTVSNVYESANTQQYCKLTVSNVKNPPTTSLTSPFEITITAPTNTAVDAITDDPNLKVTATMATMTTATIVSSSTVAGCTTATWTFTFTPVLSLPASASIVVTFPDWNAGMGDITALPYISSSTPKTCAGVSANISETLNCSYVSNTLTLSSVTTIATSDSVSFQVANVSNPPVARATYGFVIKTMASDGGYIDQSVALAVAPSTYNDLNTIVSPIISPTTVNSQGIVVLDWIGANPMMIGDIIEIDIPAELTMTATLTIIGQANLNTSPFHFTISSNTIRITNAYTTYLDPNTRVSLYVKYLINPPSTAPTGNFVVRTMASDSSPKDQGIIGKVTATPGNLLQNGSNAIVAMLKSVINSITTYTFEFKTNSIVPAGGAVKVEFPSEVKVENRDLTTACAAVASGLSTDAKCKVSSNTLYVLSGFQTGLSPGVIKFSVDSVTNPATTKPSSFFKIYTCSDETFAYLIEQSLSAATVTATPGTLPSAVVTTSSQITGDVSTYDFKLTTSITIPSGGQIQVTFPTGISISNTVAGACSSVAGFVSEISCTYTSSTNFIVIRGFDSGPFAPGNLEFIQKYVTNPPSTAAYGSFTVKTMTSDGYIIELINTGVDLQVSLPNALPLVTVTPSSLVNGATTGYTFNITVFNPTPTSCTVRITPPVTVIFPATPICTPIGVVSAVSCLMSSGVLDATIIFTSSALAGSSSFSFAIEGVKNPGTTKPSDSFDVRTLIGLDKIDALSTGITVSTTTPGSITDMKISASSSEMGSASSYTLSFTPINTHPVGAFLEVSIPAEFTIGEIACSSDVLDNSSMACTSSRTVVVNFGFLAAISPPSKIDLTISGITNPSNLNKSSPWVINSKIDIYLIDNSSTVVSSFQCSSSCSTCVTLADVCYLCDPASAKPYFYDGVCNATCRTTEVSIAGVCVPCASPCVSCTVNTTKCTACAAPTPYQYNDTCNADCLAGSWGDGSNCHTCTNPCKACVSPGTTCLACDIANSGSNVNKQTYLYSSACILPCPSKHFPNTATNECDPCDTNCSECSGTSTTCASCNGTMVLLETTCISNCPSTGMYVSVNGVCQLCAAPCVTCAGTVSTCASCSSTQFLYNASCVSSCPTGTTITSALTCETCDPNCATCSGTITNCTSCPSPDYLYNGGCVPTCPVDVTIAENGLCMPCTYLCQTCAGSPMNCMSCFPGFKLYDSTCVNLCPADITVDMDTYCEPCSYDCVQCSGTTTACTACGTGMYLYESHCLDACPPAITVTSGTECLDCSTICSTCSMTTTNCLTCPPSTYLHNGTCLATCPQGYEPSLGVCTAITLADCSTGCTSILLNNSSCDAECNVAACNYDSGKCAPGTTACADGEYSDGATCSACQYPCSKCASLASCVSCGVSVTTGLQLLLSATTCVESCSQGTYQSGIVCLSCAPPCATCIAHADTCLSCASSLYLYNNQCISSCPVGSTVVSGMTCVDCSNNCVACSGTYTTCTSCASMKVLHPPTSECLSRCPDGYTLTASTGNVCQLCTANCVACQITTATCITCTPTFYLYGTSCLAQCPLDVTIPAGNTCIPCASPCAKCIDTETTCTACITGQVLYLTTCQATCPTGYYNNSGICTENPPQTDCSPGCTSTLLNNSVCDAICNNAACDYDNLICASAGACLQGQYLNDSVCALCVYPCDACSSAEKCLSCQLDPNTSEQLLLYGTQCLSSCPVHAMTSGVSCVDCSPTCGSCSGSPSTCTSCPIGQYLYQGTCLSDCPASTTIQAGFVCEACSTNCATCLTSSDYCTSCASPLLLYANTCNESCPAGSTLTTASTTQCYPCSSPCATCDTAATTCLSCITGKSLMNKQCLDTCPSGYESILGVCAQCADGFVQASSQSGAMDTICRTLPCTYDNLVCNVPSKCTAEEYQTEDLCLTCVYPCKACLGPANCLSCRASSIDSSNLLLYHGSCVASCPAATFQSGPVCLTCDASCSQCSATATYCTACNAGQFLYRNRCIDICPVGSTVQMGVECRDCSTSCLACASTTDACTSCATGFVLSSNSCLLSCPPGSTTTATSARECVACDENCKTCLGATTTCTSCATGVLSSGQCLSACPPGFTVTLADPDTCVACSSNCKACSTAPDYCTDCSTDGFVAANHTCLMCPSGTIIDANADGGCSACSTGWFTQAGDRSTCKECDSSCQECVGDRKNCTKVTPGYYFLGEVPGECGQCEPGCEACSGAPTNCSSCALNFFPATSLPGLCLPCHASCNGCQSSASECVQCATGFKPYDLLSKKCVTADACHESCKDAISCPTAYLRCSECAPSFLLSDGYCKAITCYPGCASCRGTKFSECLSCVSPGILKNSVCEQPVCAPPCQTCFGPGPSECLTCKNTYVISATSCVCQQNYIVDEASGLCVYSGVCDDTCMDCVGPGQTDCTECGAHAGLENGGCVCEGGYTWGEGTCSYSGTCYETCKGCSGPGAKDCTACGLQAYKTTAGECVCKENYLWTSVSKSCVYSGPCPEPYTSCSDASTGLQCDSNSVFNPSGQCTRCGSSFVWVSTMNHCSRIVCHSSCVRCSGKTATDCLECDAAGHKQLTTLGTCECQQGYFAQALSTSDECLACNPRCQSCGSSSECLTCKSHAVKTATGSCDAEQGYYWDSTLKEFAPCNPSCEECDTQATTCTSCIDHAELKAGQCICKAGFYFNEESAACAACHQSCLACSDQSSCSSCRAFSILSGLACAAACPTAYSSSQGGCTGRSAAVFQLTFNSSKTVDSIGGLRCAASAGMSVVYQQGMQFNGTQRVDVPPNAEDARELVLAPSFGVELWLRPADGGAEAKDLMKKTISGKTLFGLSLAGSTLSLTVLAYTPGVPIEPTQQYYESAAAVPTQLSSGPIPSSKAWTYLRVTVETSLSAANAPSLSLSLFLNGVLANSSAPSSVFFRDFSSSEGTASFRIGGGFVGAVAEVVISAGTSAKSAAACGCQQCTAAGLCLSGCLGTEYLADGICQTCPQQCARGCLTASCAPSLDPLCLSVSDINVCAQCKSLAHFTDSVCHCNTNSQFQSASESCECVTGFKQSGSDCVPCRSYYQAKEVTMAVAATFTSLTISFARSLDISGLKSCGDMFAPETIALFGSNPKCSVLELMKIRVVFGDGFVPQASTISLLPSHISSSEGSCSYSPEPLSLKFTIELIPKPQAIITAPAIYSLACSSDQLLISGKNSRPGIPGPLQFQWTLRTDRGVLSVNVSNSDTIAIERERLFPTQLTIKLSVKDRLSEAVASTVVEVREESAIAVEFDGGSEVSVASRSKRKVTAAASGCGTAKYSFVWTSLSPEAGVAAVLASQRGATITIAGLRPGNYSFLCSVAGSANQGSAVLNVTVTSSELVIECDRSGGVISQSDQLRVNCQDSYDPDDRSEPPAALWTCESNSNPCQDKSGVPLTFDNSTMVLRVPGNTLSTSSSYNFTLTLTKDSRLKQTCIVFKVSEGTSVVCPGNTKKVSNLKALNVEFEVETKGNSEVTTTVVGGDATSMPFITIPASLLAEGGSFMVTLDLKVGDAHISTRVEILVNSPPLPGSLSVTPSSGQALTTVFQLEVSQQFDTDGPDLPITNSFGYYSQAGQAVSMATAQAAVTFATRLPSTAAQVYSRVCDSLNSCSIVKASVSVSKPRALQSLSAVSLFDTIAQSSDLVPTACIILATDFALSLLEWTYVFGKAKEFADSFSGMEDETMLPLLSCYQSLIAVKNCQSMQTLTEVTTALKTLTEKLSGGTYEEIMNREFQAVQTYLLSNETEMSLVQGYMSSAAFAFLNATYPQQAAFEATGPSFSVFARRMVAASTINATLSAGNCGLTMSPAYYADAGLNETNVLDLCVHCYLLSALPVGLATVTAAAAGSFQSLSWTPSIQQPLATSDLSQPLTLTLPVYNATALTNNTQCLVWTQGQWNNSGCKVLSSTPTSVTVAATRLGPITVMAKEIQINTTVISPVLTDEADCEDLYIPTALMVAIVLAASGSLLALRIRSLFSRKQLAEKPDSKQVTDPADISISVVQPPEQSIPSDSSPVPEPTFKPMQEELTAPKFNLSPMPEVERPSSCEISLEDASVSDVHEPEEPQDGTVPNEPGPALEACSLRSSRAAIDEPPPPKAPLSPPPAPNAKPTFMRTFLEGHYMLALALQQKEEHLACLSAMLLTQLTLLGAFYSGTTESGLMSRPEDGLIFLWTVLCSEVVSLALTTLFSPLFKKPKASRVAGFAVAAALCTIAVIAVPLMNSRMCSGPAARWSLGFMWTTINELLLGEALAAGYRLLLVKKFAKSLE